MFVLLFIYSLPRDLLWLRPPNGLFTLYSTRDTLKVKVQFGFDAIFFIKIS